MSLVRHAWLVYKKYGILELLSRSFSFAREHGYGLIVGQLFADTSIGTMFKYIISYSSILTALYFYFRRTFKHEQRAILRGHRIYHENERKKKFKAPHHRIIRHTHMIEKGLSMRDRKDVFAVEIANELVENIMSAWDRRENPSEDDQLRWSIDVLASYFDVVGSEPMLDDSRQQFQQFLDEYDIDVGNRVPRTRSSLETDPVEYSELRSLAEQRSSTRWFRDEKVSREEIDKALRIALESPSACNRQSFEYRIYDNTALLDEILQPPLGVTGYEDNIPCLVVLVGKQRAYFRESEKNVPFIDASLSAMSFQFALETLGLASCTINWPAIYSEHKRIDSLLNLNSDEIVITLMAVGYPDPDGKVPYSHKKDLNEIRSYNKS